MCILEVVNCNRVKLVLGTTSLGYENKCNKLDILCVNSELTKHHVLFISSSHGLSPAMNCVSCKGQRVNALDYKDDTVCHIFLQSFHNYYLFILLIIRQYLLTACVSCCLIIQREICYIENIKHYRFNS